MAFPVIPVAIGGAVVLATGVGLRIRAISKKSGDKPTVPIAGGLIPPVDPTFPQQQAFDQAAFAAAQKQPATRTQLDAATKAAGVTTAEYLEAITLFQTMGFPTSDGIPNAEMFARIDLATGTTPNQIADTVLMMNQTKQGGANKLTPSVPGAIGPSVVLVTPPVGKQAIVTTKDAPPSGDLIVRDGPNGTQIGGADKNGTVTILQDVDVTWAKVSWAGGRWPAVEGFSRKAFLRVV